MKKLKLLLAFCALLLGWSNASATDWVGNEVAAGEFYLYNVGADRYLGFGENWGTKATADHAGIPVTLVAGSGTYTIKTNVASSGNKLFVDGYMDGGAGKSGDWVFTDQNVAGKKVYTINIGEKYLYYDGSTIAVGNNPNSANGQWQLVTKAQRDAAFVAKNGSQSAPLDITYKYIQNPNTTYFTNVYSTSNSWTAESNAWDIKGANKDWWDGKDNNAEVWNKNFNNYMTMEDVPNGVYEFGVLGFYRDGGSETAIEHYAAGSFVGNAKIYANTDETTLQSIVTGYNSAEIYGGNDKSKTVDGVTYYIPNSQLGAALYFIRNKYNWQTVRTVVTNNTLTIGVKKSTTIGDDWTIVDKFYLSYLGVDLSSLQTTFENARNALNEFAGNIPTSYAATVSSVKAKYKDVESYSTEDEYNAAILELNTTLSTATAMVSSYAAFNALKAKANTLQAVANTNAEANNTLATAITTQTDAAEAATTASAIETATSTLKTAMITYVGAADPTSGNRFDLTFMITSCSCWMGNRANWR